MTAPATAEQLVDKLWSYCHVPRHDGVSTIDYVDQLTLLLARDKANLDLTWLRDPALGDADEHLPPEVIAQEIVEDLQAALAEFQAVADRLAEAKATRDVGGSPAT